MGNQGFYIGELSHRASVPTPTIRYYERLGLIHQPDRTEAGYRLYTDRDVERLRFIQNAKLFGLSLEEIKELIAMRSEGETPCTHLRQIVSSRLIDLDQRIQEMIDFRNQLAHRFERLAESETRPGTICGFIEDDDDTNRTKIVLSLGGASRK